MKKKLLIISIFLVIIILTINFVLVKNNYINEQISNPDITELSKIYTLLSFKQAKDFIKKKKIEEWPITKIEQFFHLNENQELYDLIEDTIRKRVNKYLFRLHVNGKYQQPADIYMDYLMEDQYSLQRDDMPYLLEFPEIFQVIKIDDNSQVKIVLDQEYTHLPLKFYTIDPHDKFISQGYKKVVPLKLNEEKILDIQPVKKGREQLIFTIVKGEKERFYKKLVWVVQKD